MFVCMTMLLKTVAMRMVVLVMAMAMRMVMAIMAVAMRVVMLVVTMAMRVVMLVMTMAMRMAVSRLRFAGTRKVVDKWNGHWCLLQQRLVLSVYAFVHDRPVTGESMNSLVGYTSESEEEPPVKRRQAVYCFVFNTPSYLYAGNYHLSPHRYHHLHPSITPHYTMDGFGRHLMSKDSSLLTCMYRCLWVANPSCTI